MKKIFVLIVVCFCCTHQYSFAQGAMSSLLENQPSAVPPQLFRLNPAQYNNHFDLALPNNGKLIVDFLRLSDWGTQNQLQAVAELAANQVRLLKDSFVHNYSNKLLEMNVPVNGQVISVNYEEDESGKRQLAYKDGNYYQLKSGFDTIRVVKNIGIRTSPQVDSGLIQVQYTFVLKDINDIQAFTDNPGILERIGNMTDSAINRQRRNWSYQDASHHTFNLTYNPEAKTPLDVDNEAGSFLPFVNKRLGLFLGIGAAFYTNNSVSPYLDETIAYLIRARGKMQYFVGANLTGFGFLSSNGNKASYVSGNFEYGVCKKAPGFMQQKSSILLGVMQKTENVNKFTMFHMGFNFGLNSFLTAGFNFATDFKKDSEHGMILVNFKFNL